MSVAGQRREFGCGQASFFDDTAQSAWVQVAVPVVWQFETDSRHIRMYQPTM